VTFKLLRSAYDLRSKAVHTGLLGKNDEQALATLTDAAHVCAKIARKLIERGSFQNWEDQFVIIGDFNIAPFSLLTWHLTWSIL
jgi:endonuclease/exonuclease/phosphatase family metal-dependent hydrolase